MKDETPGKGQRVRVLVLVAYDLDHTVTEF